MMKNYLFYPDSDPDLIKTALSRTEYLTILNMNQKDRFLIL